jgi:hypothetical protein
METTEIIKKVVHNISNGKLDSYMEGSVAKSIEKQTAKLPSDIFLWSGLGFMALGALTRLVGLRSAGQFLGHSASCILIMGVYNKVVKTHGSDRTEKLANDRTNERQSQSSGNKHSQQHFSKVRHN